MIREIWYAIRDAFAEWLEWQDAQSWAKDIHPGLLYIAKKAKKKEVRLLYREKILNAYRGNEDV